MTKSVGVHEAKTHLSALLQRVESGEEVEITRRGAAVARIVPVAPPSRRFGLDRRRYEVPEDFDEPLPDSVINEFER